MSQKRADKNRKRQRRKEKRGHLQSVSEARRDEPDLMTGIDEALRHPHPLALLELVSLIFSLTDPRLRGPFDQDDDTAVDRETLLESFLEIDNRQTTAVLYVLAALVDDDLTFARIRKELATRQHPLPDWVSRLQQVDVGEVMEMVHILGDGDDIMLGVRFPGGAEATAVVYIDHNLGTVVKDAFAVDAPIRTVLATAKGKHPDPDTRYRHLDLADARVRITEAIDWGARTYPPLETDTWPGCRPLIEWLVRLLPPGGRGYERPEWDDAATDRLRDDFFASAHGADLDDRDRRGLLGSILWFGTDYGPGDPLRWSPVNVEILLADWIPRKIVADAEHLSKAPDLLRAFIRYCHERKGIRAALTTETLAAVDEWEPEYQRLIRSPRPQGAAAIAAAMELAAVHERDDDWYDDLSFEEIMLESLDRAVGDRETLMNLDDGALPDEVFDWSGVPEDIRSRVDEVLMLCDACCEELLDTEYRTACRRFLSRVAVGDPNIFRRKARANTAAAAVCWVIAKANDEFSGYGSGLAVQDLMGFFGVTGSPRRAGTLLRAAGIADRQYGAMNLGAPDLLVSSRRAWIIERRDAYLES